MNVREALPELELLQDAATRDAVERVWTRAFALSPHERLEDAPFNPGATRSTLVAHTRAVTQAADALARIVTELHGIAVDRELLLAAALLHDVSKLLEVDPDGSRSETGRLYPHAYLAGELARAEGLGDDVVNLVLTHTPVVNMEGRRVVEAQLLEHADLASAHLLLHDEGLEIPRG